MKKTSMIYEMVRSRNGVKCQELVDELGWKWNSVSGILSGLKAEKKIINKDGIWTAFSKFGSSELDIINRLKDVTDESLANLWSEGYLSALADHGIIDEKQFDKLIDYIKVN